MPSGVDATRRDPGGCPSAPCVAGTRVRFGCPRRGQTVERCRFARRLRRGSIASRPGWAHPGSGSLARDACRRDLHRRPQSAASSHPRRGDRPVSAARRDAQEILEDLAEAIDAAAERVALGKNRWDGERPLRLAGEAVVGRLGDIATKLPSELVAGTSELPWAEIKGMRIVVDHAYHGIDYERVWRAPRDDVPELDRVVRRWIGAHLDHEIDPPGEKRRTCPSSPGQPGAGRSRGAPRSGEAPGRSARAPCGHSPSPPAPRGRRRPTRRCS